MVGVDMSEEAIKMAKEVESEDSGIEYCVSSICDLPFKKDRFYIVVSNIVLSDLRNLRKALREILRILKSDGKLVFSIMHPYFSSAPVHC